MILTTIPGDTLMAIATRYTLSPAYADAIALHNGLYLDDGVSPMSAYANVNVVAQTLDIPNEWIRPEVWAMAPGGAPGAGKGVPSWVLIGLAALFVWSAM